MAPPAKLLQDGSRLILREAREEASRWSDNGFVQNEEGEKLTHILKASAEAMPMVYKTDLVNKQARAEYRAIDLTQRILELLKNYPNVPPVESFPDPKPKAQEVHLARQKALEAINDQDTFNDLAQTLNEAHRSIDLLSSILDDPPSWEQEDEPLNQADETEEGPETDELNQLMDEDQVWESLLGQEVAMAEKQPLLVESLKASSEQAERSNGQMDQVTLSLLEEMEAAGRIELECFDRSLPVNDVTSLLDAVEKATEREHVKLEAYREFLKLCCPVKASILETDNLDRNASKPTVTVQFSADIPPRPQSLFPRPAEENADERILLGPSQLNIEFREDATNETMTSFGVKSKPLVFETRIFKDKKKKTIRDKLAAFQTGVEITKKLEADGLSEHKRVAYLLLNPE